MEHIANEVKHSLNCTKWDLELLQAKMEELEDEIFQLKKSRKEDISERERVMKTEHDIREVKHAVEECILEDVLHANELFGCLADFLDALAYPVCNTFLYLI